MSFFGAISITALILVLSFPGGFERQVWVIAPHQYFLALVLVLGVTSASAVFSNLGVATGLLVQRREGNPKRLSNFVFVSTVIMLFGLLASFPMMLMAVDWIVGAVVGIFEVAMFSWYRYSIASDRGSSRSSQ